MKTFSYREMIRDFKNSEGVLVDDAVAVIRKTVKLHGPRLIQEEISQIVPKPVDRGTYRRSWRADDIPGGVTLYNFTKQAAIIEEGRRPGAKMPPVSVILAWLQRKKIVYGPFKDAWHKQKEEAHIALLIARKIKARGLPAHHVLRLASQRLDPIVRRALEKRLGRPGGHE